MATLSSLQPSITQMNEQDKFALVQAIRNRRILRPEKVRVKKEKKDELSLDGMSKDDLVKLLALLEGGG